MTAIDALESLLAERWSCRGFLDQPVPRETIDRLLAVAQRTPSWCNTQPWQLTITSGEATVKLRKALLAGFDGSGTDFDFPSTYQGVFQERRRESGWQLYDAVGIEKGDREASTAQAALAARAPFLREWFGLPDNRKIVCGISFGFADPQHRWE